MMQLKILKPLIGLVSSQRKQSNLTLGTSKLSVRFFVFVCCFAISQVALFEKTFAQRSDSLPNIVYIMADDMGLGDVKCFGQENSKAETPNIDRLASEGMMFTDAHAPVAHCIPTRMAIMTGRYAFRFQRPAQSGPWGYLNPRFGKQQFTLGTMLQNQGYHTAYIGKWHLGVQMQTKDGKNQGPTNVNYRLPITQGPNDHGFDESFILPGSLDMFPYAFIRNHHWVGEVTAQKGWSAFNRVGPAAKDFEDYNVLNTFSTEVEKFVASRAKTNKAAKAAKPFFLYFALTAPHTPTSPHPKFKGKSKLGLYGDFLMETDDCVGRLTKALAKHGLDDNTLVVFTSDHGAAAYAGNIAKATARQFKQMEALGHYSSGIYRGYKFSAYEGGTRIPLVVRWPGKVKPGTQSKSLVGLNDMMSTFGEVAGYTFKEDQAVDSISFLQQLGTKASSTKPKRTSLLSRASNAFTYRKGDWKLLMCPGSGCAGNYGNSPPRNEAWKKARNQAGAAVTKADLKKAPFCQLYNLSQDPGETKNQAAMQPDVVSEMWDEVEAILNRGRSTEGPEQPNDRPVNLFQDVPGFVWQKRAR